MKYIIKLTIESEVEDLSEILDFFNEEVANIIPEYLEGELDKEETCVEHAKLPLADNSYVKKLLESNDKKRIAFDNAAKHFLELDDESFGDVILTATSFSDWISSCRFDSPQSFSITIENLGLTPKAFRVDKAVTPEMMRKAMIKRATADTKGSYYTARVRDSIVEAYDDRESEKDAFNLDLSMLDACVCDAILQWSLFGEIVYD